MILDNEIEKFLKGFSNSLEDLKGHFEDCRCKCARKHEAENDEEDEDEDILSDLRDDYNACMEWGFGRGEEGALGKGRARKRWAKLHPNLPIPRILQIDFEPAPGIAALLLMFDVMPHWLESLEAAGKDIDA